MSVASHRFDNASMTSAFITSTPYRLTAIYTLKPYSGRIV